MGLKSFLKENGNLLLPTLLLLTIGLLSQYSACYNVFNKKVSHLFFRQIVWVILGLFILFYTSKVNHRIYERLSYVFYAISLFLLLYLLFSGKSVLGAKRWLRIGSFGIQPSEFMKLSLIMVCAHQISQKDWLYKKTKIIKTASFVVFPFFVVLKEPDLGTATLIILIPLSMAICRGIRIKYILTVSFVLVLLFPFIWCNLKDYQKRRIINFINPSFDPLGTGYQARQSRIAIGSGRLFGKGYLKGTQTHLNYLPQKETDFIFSVICEEWGFFGVLVLLSLYLYLIMEIFHISLKQLDMFSSFLCLGIGFHLLWQSFINIGMSSGLLPVVGLPLPFISYGGSQIIISLWEIGIVSNIQAGKFLKYEF